MNPNTMTENNNQTGLFEDPDETEVSYPPIPAAESEATGEGISAVLVSETITVPPVGQWRSRSLRDLRQGDFDTWAEAVLSEEDYATWQRVDPTVDEVNSFFASIRGGLGLDKGKSQRSSRSSRSIPRR